MAKNLYEAVIKRESIRDKELTDAEISEKTAEMVAKLDIDFIMSRIESETKKIIET